MTKLLFGELFENFKLECRLCKLWGRPEEGPNVSIRCFAVCRVHCARHHFKKSNSKFFLVKMCTRHALEILWILSLCSTMLSKHGKHFAGCKVCTHTFQYANMCVCNYCTAHVCIWKNSKWLTAYRPVQYLVDESMFTQIELNFIGLEIVFGDWF